MAMFDWYLEELLDQQPVEDIRINRNHAEILRDYTHCAVFAVENRHKVAKSSDIPAGKLAEREADIIKGQPVINDDLTILARLCLAYDAYQKAAAAIAIATLAKDLGWQKATEVFDAFASILGSDFFLSSDVYP